MKKMMKMKKEVWWRTKLKEICVKAGRGSDRKECAKWKRDNCCSLFCSRKCICILSCTCI
jgi:hypothetical protein